MQDSEGAQKALQINGLINDREWGQDPTAVTSPPRVKAGVSVSEGLRQVLALEAHSGLCSSEYVTGKHPQGLWNIAPSALPDPQGPVPHTGWTSGGVNPGGEVYADASDDFSELKTDLEFF
ncbi:hypothetical protein CB1_001428082 [Camelus ferus]|nr:hypothetical protein CB1_001428082 [Camelus ferus]